MKSHTLSIIPSFGMSGEENQEFIITCRSPDDISLSSPENLSAFLFNMTGLRIQLHIHTIRQERDGQVVPGCTGVNLTIHASGPIPNLSDKHAERRFDLVLYDGDREVGQEKEVFFLYDSIVVLVHGFLASPRTFDHVLATREEGILFLVFNYEDKNFLPATRIQDSFHAFITRELTGNGYFGRFDIVCHSMGAQITRLWMHSYPANNNANAVRVRQWIGIAPVNHGSAGADGFMAAIVGSLFNRPAFSELQTGSMTVKILDDNQQNEAESLVKYRVIIGYNGRKKWFFYVWYEQDFFPAGVQKILTRWGFPNGFPIPLGIRGLTRSVYRPGKVYYPTYYGDGAIANYLSMLPYASIDAFEGRNHSAIMTDPEVCASVIHYLRDNPAVTRNRAFETVIESDLRSHLKCRKPGTCQEIGEEP